MNDTRTAAPTRLLVVEDDVEVRTALEELLHMEGYETTGATNGLEALALLRQGYAPDLILLDLMMPGMDGWEFRIEQKRQPALARIPVVAMSADASAKAAAIDADAYVKKPYSFTDLLAAIENAVRAAHARRQEHQDRMAALGTLAAGIAHEINNPLSFVIANLQFLEERLPRQGGREPLADVDEMRAVLREALQGAERIRRIVRDVKTFSNAGEERRVPVDVEQVLDSCLGMVANELRHRATVVRQYCKAPLVLATHSWLGQVFVHLLLNAAHALPEGDADRHELRVHTRADDQGKAVVEIADTGDGIAPEARGRVFDPFFTTKPVGSGSGLGLSIVHGIVTALGGTIALESQQGRGTVVRVSLPPAPTLDESRPAPSPATTGPAAFTTSQRRLLVVEDEPALARAFQRMLRGSHQVTVARGGREALELLRSGQRFDALLCDLLMPEMTGMELHEQVRAEFPGLERRIVFMTGGAFTSRAREFLDEVQNPYLAKPFDLQGVVGALEKLDAPS
jgi:signal transduction histidine kinase